MTVQRRCCACDKLHDKHNFSNNQWKKGVEASRCKGCVASGKERKSSSKRQRTSSLAGLDAKPPAKKLKVNSDINSSAQYIEDPGLSDLGPEILAMIVSLVGSFYGKTKLREVSVAFNKGVSLALGQEIHITDMDIDLGFHVAALRYVCRVANDTKVLLAPGKYDLEGDIDPYDAEANCDIVKCSTCGDCIEGMRFGLDSSDPPVQWKPDKGSLVIRADGITLCCADPVRTASINFDTGLFGEDDPLINFALVVRAKGVTLEGVNTKGGLSIYLIDEASMSAKRCSFGGTATLFGSASFQDCTVRDGAYGGISSCGDLTMNRCFLVDNESDCLNGFGDPGVEVDGKAEIKDSYVLSRSELELGGYFDEEHYHEPYFDQEKEMYCMRIKDRLE